MAQQGEAGASVHLSFDHLGLAVDSFGASVVVWHGECGGGCLDVEVEAAGEGVQVGQVGGARAGAPLAGLGGVPGQRAVGCSTGSGAAGRRAVGLEAFAELYRRLVDRVVSFTAWRVSDPDDVADIVAATFVIALESADGYDPGRGEPIAWLLGICSRLLANQRRRAAGGQL